MVGACCFLWAHCAAWIADVFFLDKVLQMCVIFWHGRDTERILVALIVLSRTATGATGNGKRKKNRGRDAKG